MASAAKSSEKTVVEKPEAEEPSPYAVNKTLFSDASAVKEKLKLFENRLSKMEEFRKQVSDTVFLKVRTDYEAQLDGIRSEFLGKCREIEEELRKLYQAQSEQQAALDKHQETLEEAKFRHNLGEYSDKKFKELESSENKEIKKFSELIEIIKSSIKQYEEILGAPFNPTPPKAAPKKVEENFSDQTIAKLEASELSEEEPIAVPESHNVGSFENRAQDDLDMFLDVEGDYFTSEEPAAEEKAPATPPPSLSKPEVPKPAKPTAKADMEDSISSILTELPFEESDKGVTQAVGEETGASIELDDFPVEASLVLTEGELDETEFILGDNTSIGRSASNDIVLKETKVSRQHAAINLRDGQYIIVDLKSSNGIFINGNKVEEAILQDGDEVAVGSFKFKFNMA